MAKVTLTDENFKRLIERIKEAPVGDKDALERIQAEFAASNAGKRGRQPAMPYDRVQEYVNRAVARLQEKGQKVTIASIGKQAMIMMVLELGEDGSFPSESAIMASLNKGKLVSPIEKTTPPVSNEETPVSEETLASNAVVVNETVQTVEETPAGEPVTFQTVSEGMVVNHAVTPEVVKTKQSKKRAKVHA